MEGRELQHFFHEHPLILKAEEHRTNGGIDHPEKEINCDGCLLPISGPFYSCGECRYFLHKVCAELPSSLDHPLHPEHPLALIECAPYEDGDYECDFCEKSGSGLVYHCSVCSFDLDPGCAFPTYKIKDKCHPHPLTPEKVPTALACHICRLQEKGLFYKCDVCPFLVHQNCTTEHSDHDHPYPFRVLQHFFHKHPLILKVERSKDNGGNDHPEKEIKCKGCGLPISGPFYSCGECRYFLHKVCAELPSALDHPKHPQHPLTLLKRNLCPKSSRGSRGFFCSLCESKVGRSRFLYHCSECRYESRFRVDINCALASHNIKDKCHPHSLTPLQVPITFICHICRNKEEGLSYKCYSCPFWVHQKCTLQADTVEHSHHEDPFPFREMHHFLHDHPLILLANENKTEDGIDHSNVKLKCNGCMTGILGPFYSCGECRYFLHKVCAELPSELDHPLHSQHPLTLKYFHSLECTLCRKTGYRVMGYTCSICMFYVDMTCASATHVIHDKCHPHPLTPSQDPISFPCHICLVEKKSPSYRCNSCPFGVHQNCTLIPDTAKHSDHNHLLKLFPSIPIEFSKVSEDCDICHSKLVMFQCIYGCDRCRFFAHVSCARSETIQSPSTSRDQNTDGQSVIHLPMKQHSTDLISQFARNYIDGDANIENKIDHFDHEHPLFLIDEETTGNKTCEACSVRISAPSYGCVDCDYFLHKCCSDLPKQISHPRHPQHQLTLQSAQRVLWCRCCDQYCNSFIYKCSSECEEDFEMDIKCGSILEGAVVYHEAHKHPLRLPIIKPSSTFCTACADEIFSGNFFHAPWLKCNTCSFELCIRCAMAPAVIRHRYGGKSEEPFRLTYSPPSENHYHDEYLCEICLKELNPKEWYYHCLFADQFAHVRCMVLSGADSNIKYGKSHMDKRFHKEHEVTTISCKYDCSPCSLCRYPMRITSLYYGGAGVGLECKTCNFRCHRSCP